jgi:hypothetical protein
MPGILTTITRSADNKYVITDSLFNARPGLYMDNIGQLCSQPHSTISFIEWIKTGSLNSPLFIISVHEDHTKYKPKIAVLFFSP